MISHSGSDLHSLDFEYFFICQLVIAIVFLAKISVSTF